MHGIKIALTFVALNAGTMADGLEICGCKLFENESWQNEVAKMKLVDVKGKGHLRGNKLKQKTQKKVAPKGTKVVFPVQNAGMLRKQIGEIFTELKTVGKVEAKLATWEQENEEYLQKKMDAEAVTKALSPLMQKVKANSTAESQRKLYLISRVLLKGMAVEAEEEGDAGAQEGDFQHWDAQIEKLATLEKQRKELEEQVEEIKQEILTLENEIEAADDDLNVDEGTLLVLGTRKRSLFGQEDELKSDLEENEKEIVDVQAALQEIFWEG